MRRREQTLHGRQGHVTCSRAYGRVSPASLTLQLALPSLPEGIITQNFQGNFTGNSKQRVVCDLPVFNA